MGHNPREYQLLPTGTLLVHFRTTDFGFEYYISMVSTVIIIDGDLGSNIS